MLPRLQLVMITASALLFASLASHLLIAALGIHTKAASGHKHFGLQNEPAQALISGSSLTYDAFDWKAVANTLGLVIESWPLPGSSPAEWEQLQRRSPQVRMTFVGISPYDLNEDWLCDFRAEVVPLGQTVKDLWRSRVDAAFCKRLLSCYPRMWARKLFPTVGRSQRVIFGLRDKARCLLGCGEGGDLEATPKLRLAADFTSEDSISAWPRDRLLRRLAAMRSLCQGRHSFRGPKSLALSRLLKRARSQGSVVVIVLPVSPPYLQEFVSPEDALRFEDALTEARRRVPEAHWVRLDELSSLRSADYYYDPVHLNMQGRQIATEFLLNKLKSFQDQL